MSISSDFLIILYTGDAKSRNSDKMAQNIADVIEVIPDAEAEDVTQENVAEADDGDDDNRRLIPGRTANLASETSSRTRDVEATGAAQGGGTLKDEVMMFLCCLCSTSVTRLSAVLLFIGLFAFSASCTISQYLHTSQPEPFPKYVVPWVIICFEVVASIFLAVMLRFAHTQRAHDADAANQPWHVKLRHNIKLLSIVPFFVFSFVFDVLRLIAGWTCRDAWLACGSNVVARVHVVDDLSYSLARFIYLFIVLIVCVRFNEANFSQRWWTLAGLAVVQATNLSVWLNALVDESIVFTSKDNWTHELSRCFDGGTDANISDHFRRCYSHTTGEFRLLESASPYLFPFIMEYLMLVMECVADWFFSDANQQTTAPHPAASQPKRHGNFSAYLK